MSYSNNFNIRALKIEMLTDMYLAFVDSFSDYQIPFKLNKEQFVKKFVQRLEIDFDLSAGTWDINQRMVAFIFTSVAKYKNILTAYNGGTGVRPTARNKKLVAKMYEYLFPKMLERKVEQCVLEVLVTNDKAINVYQSIGFKKTNLFKCYKLEQSIKKDSSNPNLLFKEVNQANWDWYNSISDRIPSFLDARLNNLHPLSQEKVIEAHIDNNCIGFVVYNPAFLRINQLAVAKEYRRMRVGTGLIHQIWQNEGKKAVTVLNVSDNAPDLNGFFEQLGFKNQLNQYEMTLTL